VSQEILHRHVAIGRNGRVGQAGELRVGARHADALALERRQKFCNRIGQLDLAVLDQHHGGDGDQRLRHRIDAEHGIERHRLASGLILESDSIGVDELTLAGDHDHGSRKLVLIDLALERLPDALQFLRRHSDLLGRRFCQRKCALERGRGEPKGAKQDAAKQNGAEHRSFHDGFLPIGWPRQFFRQHSRNDGALRMRVCGFPAKAGRPIPAHPCKTPKSNEC
jgi:hypothetical protein